MQKTHISNNSEAVTDRGDGNTYLRASSLSNYADCMLRGAARIIPKEIVAAGYEIRSLPGNIGAAVGSGTHAGTGYLLAEKMNTGSIGNSTEADQRALQELDERLAGGVIWDATTGNINTAQQQIVRMVRTYRINTAPSINPIAVEERIDKDFGDGFIVTGQADLLESEILHDTKTGVTRRANAPQYGCYSLLRRSDGHTINGILEDYIPRVGAKKEQPPPEQHSYDVASAERLAWMVLQRMKADITKFREAEDIWTFLPNPASQLCSDKYCPLHGTTTCKAWKRED